MDLPEKAVFFHVFKCGGTSMLNRLESIYQPEDIAPGRHNLPISKLPLNDYKLYCGHIDGITFNRILDAGPAYSFTVLREPIDRLISQYYHFKRTNEQHNPHNDPRFTYRREKAQNVGLVEFLLDDSPALTFYNDNHYTKVFSGNSQLFLGDPHSAYTEALEVLEKMDYVGCLELMGESCEAIYQGSGIDLRSPERQNVSKKLKDSLPTEVIKELIERNRWDYQIYWKYRAIQTQQIHDGVEQSQKQKLRA